MKRIFIAITQYLAAVLVVAAIMRAYGCADTGSINPVAELASLTVTPGTLQPAFAGEITQYNVDLTSDVTSVRVTAQPAVAGDTVTINGQAATSRTISLGLEGSTTSVSIVVSESSSNSRTYIVLLKRANSAVNNSLQSLTISPGTLTPAFNANTLTYSVEVADHVASVNVSATKADPNAVISGSVTAGAGIATGSALIPLGGPGTSTVVSIIVTASSQSSKAYTIIVERALQASNNNLSGVAVSPGRLSPSFSAGRTSYTVNVGRRVTSVTVTAILQDSNAAMEVNGQGTSSGQARDISLGAAGSSTNITIIVTPPNGDTKTYTITVNRAAPNGGSGNNGGDGDGDDD